VSFASHQSWYALHVASQREFCCAGEVKTETYIPATSVTYANRHTIKRPIFPGYVFARKCELELIYGPLRYTRWLFSILSDRFGTPLEIPDEQITSLRILLATPKVVIEITDLYHGGEEVEVIAGPLMGSFGRVAFVKGKARLIVSIDMLGRSISTDIDAADVKLVNSIPLAA
jgi:transcription antitermination factor NusG